ncbi:MAG: hypothetical protein KDB94_07810 [Acidobacteria bacterium]|nr:hypothetical protein [Acidobacteriota bacterium]
MIGWAALLYLAATLAIGFWAKRRTRGAADFFVAGRALGLGVVVLATMSTAFSGFAFIGGPGLVYRMGVSSLTICLSVGFTAALLVWTAGGRLARLAAARETLTLADALAARFASPLPGAAAAVATVVGSIGYLGAQALALGLAIQGAFGLEARLGDASLPVATAIGVAILVVYTVAGGMVASAWTDVLQGGIMLVCGVGVCAVALGATGGLSGMLDSIATSDAFGPRFLEPLGDRPTVGLGFYLLFGLGVLGQPHLLQKFLMLRDPERLRAMPLLLAGSQTLCLLLWAGIGLAVPALVATGRLAPLVAPDAATPTFLAEVAPAPLAALVLAGVLAAIMSTADSIASVVAAALARDLPRALGRPVRDELSAGRWAIAATLVVAAAVALAYGDLVALLGTLSYGALAASLTPVFALGLAWPRATARAATASIVVGLGVHLALEAVARLAHPPFLAPPASAALLGLLAGLVTLVAVSFADRGEPAALPTEIAEALD